MKNLLFILSLFSFLHLSAQEDLAIGQWRAHLPYHCFKHLAQSESTVYCATEWSLLLLDKEEMSLQYLSKVDGLSHTGINLIKYNDANDALIVAYTNSVFDIVTADEILTFEGIKTGGNFVDRTIYDIYIDNRNFAYFSCGFGVIKFDLNQEEFVFTVDLGIPVQAVSTLNGTIYASTEEGIYTAPDDDNLNLQDFNNWRLLDINDGFPAVYSSQALAIFDNQLYFDMNDEVHLLTKDGPELVHQTEAGFGIRYLTAEGKGLLIGLYCKNNCNGKTLYLDKNGIMEQLGNDCANRPLYAIEDQQNRVWLADSWRGLRLSSSMTSPCDKMQFNSPLTQNSSEIAIKDDAIYVASGGVTTQGSAVLRKDGGFIWKEGDWSIHNANTHTNLSSLEDAVDFYKVAVADDGTVYFGTFWGGILRLNLDNTVTVFNETNSPLKGAVGDEARERISGLAFDTEGNLWISNHLSPEPIVVLQKDGSWRSFSVPGDTELRNLVIDQNGYKWFTIDGTGQGLLVFNDNGTINNISDDQYIVLSSSNTDLPNNAAQSLAVDLDGTLWIGTTDGVGISQCGSSIFDGTCGISKIVVEENAFDDEPEHLFKGEEITTIAVDGANRKWFGTTSGVFVQSPNGKDQVAFFDESNSPLFDNNIIDIAINGKNGEAFVGTNKGILSYRSNAVDGGLSNSPSIYAYPNPVRPDYEGPIAIRGLARDANVKITDVSGKLIYETTALGGQAIWDGRDYNGRKASTGVYLVFSTSNSLENPDAVVTKILMVN